MEKTKSQEKQGKANGVPLPLALALCLISGAIGGIIAVCTLTGWFDISVFAVSGTGSRLSAAAQSEAKTPYLEASIVVDENNPEHGTVTIGDTTYSGRIHRLDAVTTLFDAENGMLVFDGNGIAYLYSRERMTREEERLVRNIILLDGITAIEAGKSYGYYDNLLTVTVASDLNYIGSTFILCSNLHTVELLGDCQVIKGRAFRECKMLSTVILPSGVTVEQGAFEGCIFQPPDSMRSKN